MTGSLSTQQVRHFEQHGYLCPLAGIPAAEAGDYAARLADYEERLGVEPQKYFKIKAHIAAPWMVELGRHSALVDAVESLIGPDILLFGASLFSKKAHDSRFVSWHQDSAYYGLDPHEEVTVWVALTESRRENGCLRVIPGTHRGPDLKHDETYDPENLLARGQTIRGLNESDAIDLELEAGQISIHQERTVHGSLGNGSDRARIGLAYFYMPAHTRSTLGRRRATMIRGVDHYGHWDADRLPQHDLDPVSIEELKAAWKAYQDRGFSQSAETTPQ